MIDNEYLLLSGKYILQNTGRLAFDPGEPENNHQDIRRGRFTKGDPMNLKNLSIFLLLLMLMTAGAAYADSSGTCGTNVSWEITGNEIIFRPNGSDPLWTAECTDVFRNNNNPDIKTVRTDENDRIQLSTGYKMFQDCLYVEEMHLGALNTSGVTSMSVMFDNCPNLESIYGTGSWDTSLVTTMSYMFQDDAKLKNLDVSSWNTGNVQNMESMFKDCSSLQDLNVTNWNTSYVQNFFETFSGCKSLTGLDVSQWKTGSAVTMSYMFYECDNLTGLEVGNWNTSSVTDMSAMFYECDNLNGLDVSNWNTSAVTSMDSLFMNCQKLTGLNVSNWVTSSVENMNYIFHGCISLNGLDVSGWDTSAVKSMESTFSTCYALTDLDVSNWDTSKVENMNWMFSYCEALTSLDLSGLETSSVLSMEGMFQGNLKLQSLDVSGWDTSGVANMTKIFSGCKALTSLDLTDWDTAAVGQADDAFTSCDELKTLTLGEYSVGSNIFSSLPDYSSVWAYIEEGPAASAPLPIGTTKEDNRLFTEYSADEMAGTWIVIDEDSRVTVTFDPNGGDGLMEPLKPIIGIPTALTTNSFTREGFTFTGWNTETDGSGDAYTDEEEVTIKADLTLYAQWKEEKPEPAFVTITFDPNGGDGTMKPQEISPNTPTKLSVNSFTREGFTFTGWNTKADGSATSYADKEEVSLDTDLTLYAQWEEDQEETQLDAIVKNVRNDGSKKAPSDLKDGGKIRFSIEIKHGSESYTSEKYTLQTKEIKGKYEYPIKLTFKEKLPKITSKYSVEVKDLTKYILGYDEPVYGLPQQTHKYYLTGKAWVNNKGEIEILLIWTDERTSGPDDDIAVYSLPEDEIGAYVIYQNGEKEYLVFHTYEICMNYLGSDDLCRGYERCFHK